MKRPAWLAGAALLAVVVLLVLRLTQALTRAAPVARPAIPTVTVTSVVMSSVPTTVNITGTIAARYDVPIGVEGDGGRIAAIYVEAGDHVKRGLPLVRLDVSVLKPQVGSLEAGLEQSRAEAELAQAEYRRALAVGASGALSAEETERRRSTAVTAAAKVKVAAAQLAEAQARLARTEVRAPADGVILMRAAELGQTASPGGPALFRLAQGGEIELRGQVAEQDLPLLRVGQIATVHVTGVTQAFRGTVRLLGPIIDPQTRLGSVRIALDPGPDLRPGAFARAEVTVSNAERAVLPQTAVLTDEMGGYVYIVEASGALARRPVRVGGVVAGGVSIAEGLGASDRVVATAGAFLHEGELVRPADAGGGS